MADSAMPGLRDEPAAVRIWILLYVLGWSAILRARTTSIDTQAATATARPG